MPRPGLRTKSKRKVYVRTPGGRTVVHYRERNYKNHKCALCGKVLHGIPRGRNVDFKNMAKSEKRVERPFGGMLCSECARRIYKLRAEVLFNEELRQKYSKHPIMRWYLNL